VTRDDLVPSAPGESSPVLSVELHQSLRELRGSAWLLERDADPAHDQGVAHGIQPDVRIAVRESVEPGCVKEREHAAAVAGGALELWLEVVTEEKDEIGGTDSPNVPR
jgi:hypothetical protein